MVIKGDTGTKRGRSWVSDATYPVWGSVMWLTKRENQVWQHVSGEFSYGALGHAGASGNKARVRSPPLLQSKTKIGGGGSFGRSVVFRSDSWLGQSMRVRAGVRSGVLACCWADPVAGSGHRGLRKKPGWRRRMGGVVLWWVDGKAGRSQCRDRRGAVGSSVSGCWALASVGFRRGPGGLITWRRDQMTFVDGEGTKKDQEMIESWIRGHGQWPRRADIKPVAGPVGGSLSQGLLDRRHTRRSGKGEDATSTWTPLQASVTLWS